MSGVACAIVGLGAVTPVGLSAPASCAALRAGIPRMLEFVGYSDSGESPVPGLVAGRVPLEWLDEAPIEEWPGHERWNLEPPRPHLMIAPGPERLIDLARPAAAEAWHAAGAPAGRAGIYLGVDDGDSTTPIAEAIAQDLGMSFEIARGDRLGRAAGLAALHRAARHLRDDRVDVALVGGVDSLLRRDRLAALSTRDGLKIEGSATGIIPGEAAAFVVLEPAGRTRRPLALLNASAIGKEPTAGTDDPNQGVGLTRTLREAYEAAGGAPKDYPWVICDLNGDRYRVQEWIYAGLRVMGSQRTRPGGPRHVDKQHPADCIGDSGAASGLLNVVWAVTALHRGYARIDHALVWGASDGPLRAVALLTSDDSRRN